MTRHFERERFLKSDRISKVAVIGAGSWGTALANLLAEKEGVDVDLWAREEEVYREITEKHMNHVFLPDVKLTSSLKATASFKDALKGKELVLIAVPSHVFREVLKGLKPHLTSDMSVMMATKGIENDSLMTMSQVVEEVLGHGFSLRFACLAGPSFAKEVARKLPTAVSVACGDPKHGGRLQRLFSTDFFSCLLEQGCGWNAIGRRAQKRHRHRRRRLRRAYFRFKCARRTHHKGSGGDYPAWGENGVQSAYLCRSCRDGRPRAYVHRVI